jgi:hypothetical protein
MFPSLYGMLAGVTEQKTYGDDVALYIKANVPGFFTASLDTFPMAESFYAFWRQGWEAAKDTAFWRVTSRNVANVVITDAAIMARWLGFTYEDPVVSSGGVSDGDKGDITVSGSGTVWTIDAGAVTLAKQANMATASVVYRKTAGSGPPEVNSLATLKTDLGLTGTNSGDQTITLTGMVTGSGTGSFAASLGSFTKAQLDTAVSDGNVLYVGDVTTNATHTGDATGATALTLATINSNVGAFGSATQVPTFTVNAKGLTTAAANVAISIPATAISDSTAAGRAVVTAATATAQTALFDLFTSGAKGLAPASGGGTTNFLRADGTWAAPSGGGGSLTVQDEGVTLSSAVTTINFTGAGVTATGTTTVTVDIPGGGAGSFDYGINAAMSGLTPY